MRQTIPCSFCGRGMRAASQERGRTVHCTSIMSSLYLHKRSALASGKVAQQQFEGCDVERSLCQVQFTTNRHIQGGGRNMSRGEYFVVGGFVFQMCAKFPAQFSGHCAK